MKFLSLEFLEVDKQGKIYIPASIASKIGLKSSDKLIAVVYDDHIEIGPLSMEVIKKSISWKHATTQQTLEGLSESSIYQVQEEKISQQKPPMHFKGITEDQKYEIMDLCQKLDIEPPRNLDSWSYGYADTYIKDLKRKLSSKVEEEPATDPQKEYIRKLKEKAGEEVIEEELENLTKKEAHEEIDRLKKTLGMK